MIISYFTLIAIDNQRAVAVDIGKAIKPIPVRLNKKELDVVAIITILSKDFNIVVVVLYYFYFFFDLMFLSGKYTIICLMLLICLLKLLTSFNFFSTLCSKPLFSLVRLGIVDLFSLPFKWYKIKQIFRDISLCPCDRN